MNAFIHAKFQTYTKYLGTYLSSAFHFHTFDSQSQVVFLAAASHSEGLVQTTCPSCTCHPQT